MRRSPVSSEIVQLCRLLCDLGVPSLQPTPLYADNATAICIANNPMHYERTKDIEVDCHSFPCHIL